MYVLINIRSYGVVTLAGPTVSTTPNGPIQIETSNILAVGITR